MFNKTINDSVLSLGNNGNTDYVTVVDHVGTPDHLGTSSILITRRHTVVPTWSASVRVVSESFLMPGSCYYLRKNNA